MCMLTHVITLLGCALMVYGQFDGFDMSTFFTGRSIEGILADAHKRIEEMRNYYRPFVRRPKTLDASVMRTFLQRTTPRSESLEKTQVDFEEATRLIQERYSLNPEDTAKLYDTELQSDEKNGTVEGCKNLYKLKPCNGKIKYRTIDGCCNNLQNPTWGMTATCFERLTYAEYADGIAKIRQSCDGGPLANARDVSSTIHVDNRHFSRRMTHMAMQFGEFVIHDITYTPASVGPGECCPTSKNSPPQCNPIIVNPHDRFYSKYNISCLSHSRSAPCATCKLGPRQQTNQVTHFLDGSVVYGSETNYSRSLRTLTKGLLRFQQTAESKGMLLSASQNPEADLCSFQVPELNCFEAGDERVNQQPGLASLHTLLLRDHNAIALILGRLNRHWDDEKIYQEARRIIAAALQHVHYGELLPLIVGHALMEKYGLAVRKSGYSRYNPELNPGLFNEFSSAAFRFGHTMIGTWMGPAPNPLNEPVKLRDNYIWPFGLYYGDTDRVLRGLVSSPSGYVDRHLVQDIGDYLYKIRGNETGLDLGAINIMRARDHGIPSYTSVLRSLGIVDIKSFDDLTKLMPLQTVQLFKHLYNCVEDIDLFPGAMSEYPYDGSLLGPTFTNIIIDQFKRLKDGDRFYYEHGGQSGSFTPGQLKEMRNYSLAKMICRNTEVEEIQVRALEFPHITNNPLVKCTELEDIDWSHWVE